ncbi:MAG: YHS domain protein [Burkholderiaceae bacterium]|nr:YHS domain protein [Burkholderiaceae bacterium]
MTTSTNAGFDTLNISKGGTLAGPGRAAHGYDVVSLFTNTKLVGSDAFAIAHEGATYRFASEENLRAFEASPGKYMPQFGGFCAFGVTISKKLDGDPLFSKVVDGKLYFNLNADILAAFEGDVAGNIAKAEGIWTTIQSTAVSAL